jgi:hypothetical protein
MTDAYQPAGDRRHCPVHAEPGADVGHAWPCPDDCLDFLDELERRVQDVTVHGNFVRMSVVDGVLYRQHFRDHKPTGEPTPVISWKAKRE